MSSGDHRASDAPPPPAGEEEEERRHPTTAFGRWWIRIGEVIVGWTLVGVGTVLLVLPGPGLLLIVIGLSLLARHQHWAKRILRRVKRWREKRRASVPPPRQ